MEAVDKINILIVDDDPRNQVIMGRLLHGPDRNIVAASSGAEGIRHAQDNDFAVILMDVQMPGMDGFQTAELVRQIPRAAQTPLLFVTGTHFADLHKFKGYAIGAVDYLFKPVQPEILKSKVAVFVDLFKKTEQVRQQEIQLREAERREHERRLAEERLRRDTEFRVARQIQQGLFPRAAPILAGYDIAGASHPMEATGGDYFDYFPMPGDTIGVVIGDASGHGFGPALLMAETRAYLRSLALTRTDVGEMMTLTNQALVIDTQGEYFVTLLLLQLDPATRRFVYSSAGHTPGHVIDSSGSLREELSPMALPLGIVDGVSYETSHAATLQPGDTMLLLTDGIPEAAAPDDKLFGLDRALDVTRANRHRPAHEIVAALYEATREYSQHAEQQDDMTAIVVKVAAG